jgi:hypothetical protein
MATTTAPTPSPEGIQSPPNRSTPEPAPPRRLWQVPLFLGGITILTLVTLLRPFGVDPVGRHIDRELQAAEKILNKPEGDGAVAAEHARHALELAEKHPDRLGAANFQLGSAELRLADSASANEAAEWWKSAREHLEEAERLGVPESDRDRLSYRLAKAWYYTGEQPQRVVDRLASIVDSVDDRAAAYRLLALAYLRLPEPNVKAALAVNEKLRQVPLIGPEVQAPAQLQGGELLIRLGRQDEARRVLEKIGNQAPPGVLARARVLRAQSFQAENNFQAAAGQWEALLADTREPLAERSLVVYYLGVCQNRLTQPNKPNGAIKLWEEVLQSGGGDEVPAAALALSEVWLQGESPEKAIKALTRAMEGISSPTDWKNTLVTLDQAREHFEKAQDAYRKANRHDLAMKVVEVYQKLAVPNRVALLQAEIAAEWGRSQLKHAYTLQNSNDHTREELEAHAKLREAGAAYLRLADLNPKEQESAVWLAAGCLIDAHDDAQAMKVLNRYLEIGKSERKGEAWYLLAECQARQSDPAMKLAAEKSYQNCVQQSSPFTPRALYKLALIKIEHNELDHARETLLQVLKMHDQGFETDEETLEKCRFVLGGLAYQRKDYTEVELSLKPALKAGQMPTSNDGTRARLQLAESFRLLALKWNETAAQTTSPQQQAYARAEYQRYLRNAAEEYSLLKTFLETPASAGHLSADERIRVPFVLAECCFNLGEYDVALETYAKLAERFGVRPADASSDPLSPRYAELHLEALGGIVRCYAAQGKTDEMRKRLDEIQAALPTVEEGLRRRWEEWLSLARRPLIAP